MVETRVEDSLQEQLLSKLEEEKNISSWAVKAQRALRKGRFTKLKEQGLL